MSKILVVDDSKLIRDELCQAFEDVGYKVLQGENGLEALEIIEKNQDIDLVVTDLNMPEMDGLTMIENLREQHPEFVAPIMILTTEASPGLKARGKELGVKLWAIKPVSPDSLIPPIKKLLSMSSN